MTKTTQRTSVFCCSESRLRSLESDLRTGVAGGGIEVVESSEEEEEEETRFDVLSPELLPSLSAEVVMMSGNAMGGGGVMCCLGNYEMIESKRLIKRA